MNNRVYHYIDVNALKTRYGIDVQDSNDSFPLVRLKMNASEAEEMETYGKAFRKANREGKRKPPLPKWLKDKFYL